MGRVGRKTNVLQGSTTKQLSERNCLVSVYIDVKFNEATNDFI